MISKLIDLLNDQHTSFKIQNLYEEDNTDYILVSIGSLLAAVEVSCGDKVSFRQIQSSKQDRILKTLLSTFSMS